MLAGKRPFSAGAHLAGGIRSAIEMHNLAGGMHAGVGSSSSEGLDRSVRIQLAIAASSWAWTLWPLR